MVGTRVSIRQTRMECGGHKVEVEFIVSMDGELELTPTMFGRDDRPN